MCALKVIKKTIDRDKYIRKSVAEKNVVQSIEKESLLQKISHISQIGLLALGVFGYFYTVVPVFQNQQLQEQTAKLELEKSALERDKSRSQQKLVMLKAQQSEVKQNIQMLQEKWKSEKNRNLILMNNISEARKKEIEARMSAIEAKDGFQKEKQKLTNMQWEYVLTSLIIEYSRHSWDKVFSYSFANVEYEHGSFILEKEKLWPKPYSDLIETIDIMKDHDKKRIPESYYLYIREIIDSNEKFLQCEKPDFKKMQQDYLNEISSLEPLINVELKQELDKEEQAYKAKNQRVMFTDEYQASIRRQIRLEKIFKIADKYEKPLKIQREICQNKASKVLDEITRNIQTKYLTCDNNEDCAQTVSE